MRITYSHLLTLYSLLTPSYENEYTYLFSFIPNPLILSTLHSHQNQIIKMRTWNNNIIYWVQIKCSLYKMLSFHVQSIFYFSFTAIRIKCVNTAMTSNNRTTSTMNKRKSFNMKYFIFDAPKIFFLLLRFSNRNGRRISIQLVLSKIEGSGRYEIMEEFPETGPSVLKCLKWLYDSTVGSLAINISHQWRSFLKQYFIYICYGYLIKLSAVWTNF